MAGAPPSRRNVPEDGPVPADLRVICLRGAEYQEDLKIHGA